ncbi:hypothetical protein PCANC_08005 [Puccinia coronata f. sp. avenae]|uniref:HAT C-terminal dimerisation domain-containing protein n=1 Tax=Puccinia coronata f. sp. avenae TaxID=200324 RepID=A0A2N5UGW2_9BASI|nr:hypothetical protein PCANC_08005 [Puccinia coronata f. sp. avenae]PLW36979.1 hypothetical protein PCASD_06657 [Puccinia coronata f. sp. avenae]
MHIRCFCHKLALIVNAGLASLSLKTLPQSKTKESVLGFLPVLGKLIKEEEEENAVGASGSKVVVDPSQRTPTTPLADEKKIDNASESDYSNEDDESSNNDQKSDVPKVDSDDEAATITAQKAVRHAKTTKLQELTTKLNTVIKQITRTAAQRASFTRLAKLLNMKVAPLIAGYGIRWNIKYKSHRKVIDVREVINKLLKDDQEWNKYSVFNDVMFSPQEWKEMDNLD